MCGSYSFTYISACIAAVYSTTLEKSAVEFATAYVNQQSGVDPLYWLTTINASTIPSNDMANRNVGTLH